MKNSIRLRNSVYMNTAKELLWKNLPFALLQAIILLFSILTGAIHGRSALVGLVYFVYQFAGVFLPGLALLLLIKCTSDNTIRSVAFAYGLGIGINILQYYLLISFRLDILFPSFFVLIGVASAVYVLSNLQKLTSLSASKSEWTICLSFITFLCAMNIFVVSCVNSLPHETNGNGYYVDWLYWVGNNISFTKGLPVQVFSFPGVEFRYHYLSSVFTAYSSLATTIDCVTLSFYYSFLVPSVLLVLSAYTLFSTILKDKVLIAIGILFSLLSGGITITSEWHIYICPFGYDYGVIFGLLSVALLLQCVVDHKSTKQAVLAAVMLFLTTGNKGPVGLVVLFGFGMATLTILKKDWKRGLAYGIMWLGAFVGAYLAFISSTWALDGGNALTWYGLAGAFEKNGYEQSYYNGFAPIYGESTLLKMYAKWLYIYRADNIAILLFLTGLVAMIVLLIRKRKLDVTLFVVNAICLIGCYLTSSTLNAGNSQMYFVMSVIPYGVASGLYAIENVKVKDVTCWRNSSFRLVALLLIVVMGSGAVNTSLNTLRSKYYEGILIINNQRDKAYWNAVGPRTLSNYASVPYYNALCWIRDNTPQDSIIAVDTFADQDGLSTEMVASVFSQRLTWNDGKYSWVPQEQIEHRQAVTLQALAGDQVAIAEMKESGVAYIVQSLWKTPEIVSIPELKVVYQSPEYVIYAIT